MAREKGERGLQVSNRAVALMEVVGFTALAVTSKLAVDPVSWRFSGPVTLLLTLLVLSVYRRARGQSWSEAGLRRVPGLKAKLLVVPQTALAFVAILGTGVLLSVLSNVLDIAFMQENTSAMAERLGDIRGNLPLYLLWLAVAWVSAGFAEELFFRGFLISRLVDAFDGFRFGRSMAVVVAALVFGACHVYYQGLRGLVVGGAIGLFLGILFVAWKRNLWPLIVAHALVDTLAITAHFLNWDI